MTPPLLLGPSELVPPRAGARVCRGSFGLASLEWLLVVSVSALLAALVLAFVQRNVDRSVLQVADASDTSLEVRDLARAQTFANELAFRVQTQSLEYDEYDYRFQDPEFWAEHFSTRCERLREVFSDLESEGVKVAVESDFRMRTNVGPTVGAIELGEIPWVYGNTDENPLRETLPAFTVCQVFLSY